MRCARSWFTSEPLSWFTSEPLPTPPAKLPRPQKHAAAALTVAATPSEGGAGASGSGPPADVPTAKRLKAVRSGAPSPALAPDALGKFSPRPGQAVH